MHSCLENTAAAMPDQVTEVGVLLQPLSITLRGITNDALDPCVDVWRNVTFPLIRRVAGLDDADGLQLKVLHPLKLGPTCNAVCVPTCAQWSAHQQSSPSLFEMSRLWWCVGCTRLHE